MPNGTLIIRKPTISIADGWYRLSAPLDAQNGASLEKHQKEIWFSLPYEYAEEFVLADCSDCFLLGLLYFAMRKDYDICVDGAVSTQLIYNLKNEIMPIMNAYRPIVHPIGITATIREKFQCGKGAGTGFSGGIDSFATIVNNQREHLPLEDKLTHLFFFNVGTNGHANSFEALEHIRKKFLLRFKSLMPAAKSMNLPFIPVDSNVHSFLPDTIIAAVTICNAAAVHFLRKGLAQYLLSSSGYNYIELFRYLKESPVKHHIDISLIDFLLCQWLGEDALRIIPRCTNMTRIEKTKTLVDFSPAQSYLIVCNSDEMLDKNCSTCIKCRRTMIDLELLGKLDEFRQVFDVDLYRNKFKSRDFAELLYPPVEYKSIFLRASRKYAIDHDIDINEKCAFMDRNLRISAPNVGLCPIQQTAHPKNSKTPA